MNIIKTDKIKNIIFDWGGVITNLSFDATINAFKKYGVPDFEKYYCKDYQSDLFQRHEAGAITPTEFRDELRKIIPDKITDEDMDAAWFAILLDTPKDNLNLLSLIKNQYRIFLLSNTNSIHVDRYDKIFESQFNLTGGLRSLFEKAYYSHEIGMRKPDEEIFHFVLEDSKLKPQETLFIDDSIQNINAAKRLGIKTFHLQNKSLLADLDIIKALKKQKYIRPGY